MSVKDDGGRELDVDSLKEALRAAVSRAEGAEAELEEVRRAAERAREEARLLESLISLREGSAVADSSRPAEWRSLRGDGNRGEQFRDAVVETLRAANSPLHVSRIMDLLAEAAVAVPGAGTQANLIAHIGRDQRIVRTSRGVYALAEWGLKPKASDRREARGQSGRR